MLRRRHARALTAALALAPLLLTACASTPPQPFPEPPPALPAAGRQLVMVDGHDGSPVSWEQLVERASAAHVVLWGETHGHPEGLAAAAFLFDELLEARPDGPALALEFFERDDQLALDDLAAGVTDEAGMIEALRLRPSSYPPGHRAMVRAAVAAGRPVWAANAPRRYVRLARTEDYEHLRGLGPRQTPLFEVPDTLTPGDYRARFVQAIGGHTDSSKYDGMYRSQNLWDATMADSVLRAHVERARPVMLVVGRFHVEFDGGTTQRLRQRAPWLHTLTVAVVDETAEALRDGDQGRADVVIYAGPSDA